VVQPQMGSLEMSTQYHLFDVYVG